MCTLVMQHGVQNTQRDISLNARNIQDNTLTAQLTHSTNHAITNTLPDDTEQMPPAASFLTSAVPCFLPLTLSAN